MNKSFLLKTHIHHFAFKSQNYQSETIMQNIQLHLDMKKLIMSLIHVSNDKNTLHIACKLQKSFISQL